MKKIILILSILFCQVALGQSKGTVKGKLLDGDNNNEPLSYASVAIKGTSIGTETDDDGNYQISVEAGTYFLVFSFLGYQTLEVPFTVKEGETVTINRTMEAAGVGLEEIKLSVTTSRERSAALLLEQKKAIAIQESVGAIELSQKGISDAAAAVAKISGISKQEGSSNVYVRGLGDRYQNTTLNGLSLPSTDVNKKNIDLNLFSTDIIESVSISKTYSTGFFGDFSAGNVNITSKSHRGKAYVSVTSGSGFNSNAVGESSRFVRSEGSNYFGYYNRYGSNPFAVILSHPVDPVSVGSPIATNIGIEGGGSIEFENDSKLSFFGAASFSNGFEYREGVSRDFTNVLKVNFPNVEEFEYSTTTTGLANIDYKVNDDFNLKYRFLYVNSSKDEVGYYGTQGLGTNRDANQSENGYYVMNVLFNQDQMVVNQLLGDFNSEKLRVDWGLGYNVARSDEPDRKRFTLQDYQFALDNDPNTNPTFFNNIPFDNQRFFQEIKDYEYSGFVNFKSTLSEKVKLNYGYNGRSKKRNFNSIRFGYQILDNLNNPITDVNNLDALLNVTNINIPNGSGVFNTVILNPISIDLGTRNVPGLPDSVYEGLLDIHAGYVNGEINAGKLLIVPGLRLERFSQSITYDVLNDDIPQGTSTRVEANETILLPSLNLRYALNDKMNLRASASRTVSFPEFKEVAPFVYEDVTVRYGGNPDLLGGNDGNGPNFSSIVNLDLKYEWFLTSKELVSVSLFHKIINDPVNRVVAADATGDQRYFRTGDKATVLGFEFELRKNLIQNAEEEDVLNLGFNIAYTATNQDLFPVVSGRFTTAFNKTESDLEGASDVITNVDLSWTPTFGNYKPKASLVSSYFSDRIFALGSGSLGDIIEKSVTSLDFVFKSPITENFELTFSATNLLNPNVTFVRENVGANGADVTISEFKAGVNVGLGVKYKF